MPRLDKPDREWIRAETSGREGFEQAPRGSGVCRARHEEKVFAAVGTNIHSLSAGSAQQRHLLLLSLGIYPAMTALPRYLTGQRTLLEGAKLYAVDQRRAAWPMSFGSQPTPSAKIGRKPQFEAQLVDKGVAVLRCALHLVRRPGVKPVVARHAVRHMREQSQDSRPRDRDERYGEGKLAQARQPP